MASLAKPPDGRKPTSTLHHAAAVPLQPCPGRCSLAPPWEAQSFSHSSFPVRGRCLVSGKTHCNCSPQLCLVCFGCPYFWSHLPFAFEDVTRNWFECHPLRHQISGRGCCTYPASPLTTAHPHPSWSILVTVHLQRPQKPQEYRTALRSSWH